MISLPLIATFCNINEKYYSNYSPTRETIKAHFKRQIINSRDRELMISMFNGESSDLGNVQKSRELPKPPQNPFEIHGPSQPQPHFQNHAIYGRSDLKFPCA